MHGTFSFLMDIPVALKSSELPLDERADAIDDLWTDQYGRDHLDDNNWYQHEAVLFKDGMLFGLCPEDDWRGRNTFVEKMPAGDRWAWAYRFALQCVATDIGLGGASFVGLLSNDANKQIAADTFDTLYARMHQEIPKQLSAAYAAIAGRPPVETQGGDDTWMAEYRRRSAAVAYERFRRAENPPFADSLATPYEYRCYDLLAHSIDDDAEEAIVFVDIHT